MKQYVSLKHIETKQLPCKMDSATLVTDQQKDWKKYSEYKCKVDPEDGDKAKEMKFCNASRPHMRAFYCCFWGFFNACFLWFAIAPLLPEIRTSLDLRKEDVWTSSIRVLQEIEKTGNEHHIQVQISHYPNDQLSYLIF